MERYTLAQLKRMKTKGDSHFDDLKVDRGGVRVWLSRGGVEDGEPYRNKVTVERYNQTTDHWDIVDEYQAL